MSRRGWHLNPLQHPPAVHMCFTAQHVNVVPDLLKARTPRHWPNWLTGALLHRCALHLCACISPAARRTASLVV